MTNALRANLKVIQSSFALDAMNASSSADINLDDVVNKIEQAFADEQMTYKTHPEAYEHIDKMINLPLTKLMTGQEWYDRFTKEINAIPYSPLRYHEIMQAAKRAARLDEGDD